MSKIHGAVQGSPVILSKVAGSRSEAATLSKDPCTLNCCRGDARRFHRAGVADILTSLWP
jgi:hypothetical protein